MREVDRIVTGHSGFALIEMMELAGKNLSDFIVHQWPRGVRIGPVVVLAGKGHNGGGGICCANHLTDCGVDVRLCLSSPESELAHATSAQLQHFRQRGGRVTALDELEHPFLIVDAMIGYGLRGEPDITIAGLVLWANEQSVPVVSLDAPTGLNVDTGIASAVCIKADKTVTLALPKHGLASADVGELWLSDIGINPEVYRSMGIIFDSPFAGASFIRLKHMSSTSPHFPGVPVC